MIFTLSTNGGYLQKGRYVKNAFVINIDDETKEVLSVFLNNGDVTDIYKGKVKTNSDYNRIVRAVNIALKDGVESEKLLGHFYDLENHEGKIRKNRTIYSKTKSFRGKKVGIWIDSLNENLQDEAAREYNNNIDKIEALQSQNRLILEKIRSLSTNEVKTEIVTERKKMSYDYINLNP